MNAPALLRVTEYRAYIFRAFWKTSLFNSVVTPVVFLLAMGVGVGELIDNNGSLAGVGYLSFLAPGMLAATAMHVAVSEATFPVFGSVHWDRAAYGQVASPLSPANIAYGQMVWVIIRVFLASSIFVVVMALFGAVESPWVVMAVPASVLLGLAFAVPIAAWAIGLEKMNAFPTLSRFVIAPMFLFSGTFFPVEQLPAVVRPVAYVTPLWHGVKLCRSLALGEDVLSWANLGHVVLLGSMIIFGLLLLARSYNRKLLG